MMNHYLMRTAGPSRWADSRRSYHLQQVRDNLLAASGEAEHPRDWRPNLLLFSDDAARRKKLLHFASWITGRSGFITVTQVLEGEIIQQLKQKEAVLKTIQADIDETGVKAFPLVVAASSFTQSIQIMIQAYGIGPLHANTILFDWAHPEHQVKLKQFSHKLRTVFHHGCNFVGLNMKGHHLKSLLALPPQERRIDVWWWGDRTGQLMLLLAYLMTRNKDWKGTKIRVLAACFDLDSGQTVDDLHRFLENIRIAAEPEVVIKPNPEAVAAFSEKSTLVFFPFHIKSGELITPFETPLFELIDHLPSAVLVRAVEDIDLEAEPEEGFAEIAEALDKLDEARENAQEAEQEAARASEEADDSLRKMLEISTSGAKKETLEQARNAVLEAKTNAIKAARRAADANARLESAQRRAEHLGITPPDNGMEQK